LTFCGSEIIVQSSPKGKSSKECFKEYENGKPLSQLVTNQPNLLKSVIIGKKSWGLHVKMWSDGIGDGEFRMKDILEDFEKKGIKIPDSFLRDFENSIRRRIIKNKEKRNNSNLYFNYMLNL
jgi:hypothetical protein